MIPVTIGNKEEIIAKKTQIEDWETKIKEISGMQFTELENYIEINVKDMATVKAYLKKISRVLLAIQRQNEAK